MWVCGGLSRRLGLCGSLVYSVVFLFDLISALRLTISFWWFWLNFVRFFVIAKELFVVYFPPLRLGLCDGVAALFWGFSRDCVVVAVELFVSASGFGMVFSGG